MRVFFRMFFIFAHRLVIALLRCVRFFEPADDIPVVQAVPVMFQDPRIVGKLIK